MANNYARVHSIYYTSGWEKPVIVEASIQQGVGIHMIGLVDYATKESLLRTITALQSSGFHVPGKKIIINIAPAAEHGIFAPELDLPIAIAVLAASGYISSDALDHTIIAGELGLDGSLREVPEQRFVDCGLGYGYYNFILPTRDAFKAEYTDHRGINVQYASTLLDAVKILEQCKQ